MNLPAAVADLSAAISAGPSAFAPGSPVAVAATVTNIGPDRADNVLMYVSVPTTFTPGLITAAKALAEAILDGHVKRLDGQSHDIVPSALGPVLLEFFGR